MDKNLAQAISPASQLEYFVSRTAVMPGFGEHGAKSRSLD
jgi:hypothetical protein